MCLNHELRIMQLTLFLIEKCNVKRVSSKCQECMARRGITEVDMLLLGKRNECTSCVPYSTEYSEQYRTWYSTEYSEQYRIQEIQRKSRDFQ